MIVQLHTCSSFDDVNKPVSRLAANIPLIKRNLAPLSFADAPRQTYTQSRARCLRVEENRPSQGRLHPSSGAMSARPLATVPFADPSANPTSLPRTVSRAHRRTCPRARRSRIASELAKNDVKNELATEAQTALECLDTALQRESLPAGLDLAITGGLGRSIASMIGLTADRCGIQLPLASWGAGTQPLSALAFAEQNQGDAQVQVQDHDRRANCASPCAARMVVEVHKSTLVPHG
ncbi:hypothetical protein ABIB85_007701 [Bradyrhizobium sp. JR1.5]|uniref:hypothetical protein n=1 Tax=unclassified Bradyrhizobium TaxID=2631580 RepID=UPI0033974ED3